MRTKLIIGLFAGLMLVQAGLVNAESTLAGIAVSDSLKTINEKLKVPDLIRARRMDDPTGDYAAMLFQRQGNLIVGLTHNGDKVDFVLAETPAVTTNDGLKVGDPKSLVVSKRGQPEKTSQEMAGITEYWYWTQGINFGISDSNNTIANIFIFPATTGTDGTEQASLPSDQVGIEHQYTNGGADAFIQGKVNNKTAGKLDSVRLGIILRDKDNKPVDVIFYDTGGLSPNSDTSFKVQVPSKGEWTQYSINARMGASSGQAGSTRVRTKYLDAMKTARTSAKK